MAIEFDLTTINLSAGTHRITVKARAKGFADSVASKEVSYVVAGDTVQVSGTWYLNEEPLGLKSEQRVKFVSNGTTFYSIIGIGDGNANLAYDNDEASFSNQLLTVYESSINNPTNYGWQDEAYRTITFDGAQTVSKEFYEWLTENAVQQTITFSIDGTTYTALSGMTWGEWVESEYNTGGFYIADTTGYFDCILDGSKGPNDSGDNVYMAVFLNGYIIREAKGVKIIGNAVYTMEVPYHSGGSGN